MGFTSSPSDLRITDMRFVDIDGAPKRCTILKIINKFKSAKRAASVCSSFIVSKQKVVL